MTNVEVQIGSNGYFSNNLFDSVVNLTQSNCFTNNFGFDVCLMSGDFSGPNLSGNDWITLTNASTVEGNPVYWDENSGVGCQSPGCPSQAQENSIGTIPSEAFSLEGSCFPAEEKPVTEAKVVTVPRSPTQTYRVIYNFTGGVDGGGPATGLVIDAANNLYGTTSFGGPFGDGTAFKLTPGASGWRLLGCMRSPVRMAADPTALWSSTPMAGSTAQPRAEAWAMACSSAYLLRETSCPVFSATGWRPCYTVSSAAAMVQIPEGAWCSTAQAISMEAPPWEAHITTVRSMNTPMAACRSCTLFPASPTTA
jgi:uncharacterized repeat protein (TIGR03803 family)